MNHALNSTGTDLNLQDVSICFTGRRPKDLYGYKKEPYIPLVNALKEHLIEFYNKGYRRFISGGAQGFDQLAFWAVNAAKREGYDMKNILYLPFRKQECKWLKTGLFSQYEYRLMVELADEVHYISDTDVATAKKYEINIALHKRNHAMVDDVSIVIGLYPGNGWDEPYASGGTAECLNYAKDHKKQIYILNPFTLDFSKYTA